jgi:hypothetical protein
MTEERRKWARELVAARSTELIASGWSPGERYAELLTEALDEIDRLRANARSLALALYGLPLPEGWEP